MSVNATRSADAVRAAPVVVPDDYLELIRRFPLLPIKSAS